MKKQKISILDLESINPSYKIEVYEGFSGIVEEYTCNVVKINGIKMDTNKGMFIRKNKELIDITKESETIVNIEVDKHF